MVGLLFVCFICYSPGVSFLVMFKELIFLLICFPFFMLYTITLVIPSSLEKIFSYHENSNVFMVSG